MIKKSFVYEKVIPLIQEKGKQIDVLLLRSLFEDVEKEILEHQPTHILCSIGRTHGTIDGKVYNCKAV